MVILASSNPAVIALDGTRYQPLETMTVNVFYEGEKNASPITVKGRYEQSPEDNPRPPVVPALREWKGGQGYFQFTGGLIADRELLEVAHRISSFLEPICGRPISVTCGKEQPGDIRLVCGVNPELGDEGYALDIGDEVVLVSAPGHKGILYAGITLAQMLILSDDHASIPCGLARDYPQYPVRSIMVDIGRFFMPIDYLAEVTRYAAWFKLNEIHIHINDDSGEDDGSFRIECRTCPELNGSAPFYTYDQYRAYQREARLWGIEVITEVDTPSHCAQIKRAHSELMLDGRYIDVRNPKTIEFVKSLYDEWLDGDDPVFQGRCFHIGTDEYPKEFSEEMRAYIDELIKYVNAKGLHPRFWASLGRNGFDGCTPVDNRATAHMWSHLWGTLEDMVEDGYTIINNADAPLYIVPEGAYNNYLNISRLFDTWEVTDFWYGHTMEKGHPQLLGAEASIWYDGKNGQSEFDIFDRMKDQIVLISEKCWFGEKTPYQNGEEFVKRVQGVSSMVPIANPARSVASKSEVIVDYRFQKGEDSFIRDWSGNDYHGKLVDLLISEDGLIWNGSGYLQLPFSSIGYPYTIRMELYIQDTTRENAVLFEGQDGVLYLNYHGTGKIGYERKQYSYIFDFVIPTEKWMELVLTCSSYHQVLETVLYVDGACIGHGVYYGNNGTHARESSTFVLPVERVGAGIEGKCRRLTAYNRAFTAAEVAGGSIVYKNLALGCPVSASGVEGGYDEKGLPNHPDYAPELAVDGDRFTKFVFPRRQSDAWFCVDLGETCYIDKILIRFAEMPVSYALLISEDGVNYHEAALRDNLPGRETQKDIVHFSVPVCARYVLYQQRKMFTVEGEGEYSGWFYELEVYGVKASEFRERLHRAEIAAKTAPWLRGLIDRLTQLLGTAPLAISCQTAAFLEAQIRRTDTPPSVENRNMLENLLERAGDTAVSRYGHAVSANLYADHPLVDFAINMLKRHG